MKQTAKTIMIIFVIAMIYSQNGRVIAQSSISSKSTGWLVGRVIDHCEASISSAQILIESDGNSLEITSDEAGYYQIKLPPGIYRISAKAKGWIPFKRASF